MAAHAVARYADFRRVTDDALVFATKALELELTREKRALLMDAWLHLACWPEAPDALRTLRNKGLRLAFLSDMTPEMSGRYSQLRPGGVVRSRAQHRSGAGV